MLEDFIREQLGKVASERDRLNRNMENLAGEEIDTENHIKELMENVDVGIEIFSPRTGESTVKEQIIELQEHIDKIRNKQAKIAKHIDNNRNEEKKWQNLLKEARTNPDKVPGLEERMSGNTGEGHIFLETDEDKEKRIAFSINEEHREDLIKVMERVDRCIELVHTDRVKCKSELKNLKYHLKALISKSK